MTRSNKFFLLLGLFALPLFTLRGQDLKVHIDTIEEINLSIRQDTINAASYIRSEGLNILFDEAGKLVEIGYVKRKYSTGIFSNSFKGNHLIRVGEWKHYENGVFVKSIFYDKKGNEVITRPDEE